MKGVPEPGQDSPFSHSRNYPIPRHFDPGEGDAPQGVNR